MLAPENAKKSAQQRLPGRYRTFWVVQGMKFEAKSGKNSGGFAQACAAARAAS
ncbi:hypothetical protein [Trinickia soli]|uniref:hypothetical protein n=1 Tax=Trinickia soli TaxID=380675 RepID=UPI001304F648|nr:hypothetical protein [Trinickia soli]